MGLKIVIKIQGDNTACEWGNSLKFTGSELERGLEKMWNLGKIIIDD